MTNGHLQCLISWISVHIALIRAVMSIVSFVVEVARLGTLR